MNVRFPIWRPTRGNTTGGIVVFPFACAEVAHLPRLVWLLGQLTGDLRAGVLWTTESAADRSLENTGEVVASHDRLDIAASLRGDGEAFARLIERYQQPIAAQMWKFTRDATAHEELVHDVFVEAYRGLPKFRHNSPLLHWLRTIATRTGYSYWKQRAKEKTQTGLSTEQWRMLKDGPDSTLAADQAAGLVHILLERLPPRDRLVLTLLYWEQYSIAEAAELVGWSQTRLRVQAFRARGKLKRLFESEE